MPQKNRLLQFALAITGAIFGAFCTLAVVFFDDVRGWFTPTRWNYPELANVKVENCSITGLPAALVTYAISVERGDLPTELVIGKRALHATRAVDVLVTRRDKPVVLVLAAERSVIWNVSALKGSRIAAVLVLGRDAQGLVGIPKSIPHLIIAEKANPSACGPLRIKYVKLERSPEFKALDSTAASIIGRHIDFFQNAAIGARLYAGPHKDLKTVDPMRSDELEASYRKTAETLPFGRDGLDWLLNKNLIRPARREDVDAWILGAVPADATFKMKLRVGRRMASGRTFVILDKIALPDNLRWDGNYSFILPADVPGPDHAAEAAIYRMEDFSCAPDFFCPR